MNAGANQESPVNGAANPRGSPVYGALPCSPGIHAGAAGGGLALPARLPLFTPTFPLLPLVNTPCARYLALDGPGLRGAALADRSGGREQNSHSADAADAGQRGVRLRGHRLR